MQFYANGLLIILLFIVSACVRQEKGQPSPPTLFNVVSPSHTGIDFTNQLDYTEQLNTYTYKNFYNGAGVGLGDFNNDGLIDIFFAGNMVSNKLYINNGNLSFRDISETAGVVTNGVWTTGVSLADVNGDGFLDIYVCKSGPPGGERRYNELLIRSEEHTSELQSPCNLVC